jgi:hypothetical protein
MHVVLVNIGTDWPDVFGPYTNLSEAEAVQEQLDADPRVFHTELQTIFTNVGEWQELLDEIISR